MSRYSRNLSGINAQGFVAGEAAMIAAGSDMAALVRGGIAEGSIGILADGTSNVDALVAGEVFQVVQAQDGEIRSSIELTYGDDIVVTKQLYDAPVIQVDETVITNAELTALLGVAGLKEFVIACRDTTPSNQPFPVMEGRATVRNTTTGNYAMLLALIKSTNGDGDYERNQDDLFAVAFVQNAGVAGAVSVATDADLTQGSNVAVFNAAPAGPTIGEYIAFEPAGSGAAEDLYKIVDIDGANVILDRNWYHATQNVLIADMKVGATVTGDWTLGFVGKDIETHFSSVATEDLEDYNFSTVQEWKQGSGDYPSVDRMEQEFSVFKGETTINAAFKEDYGTAATFADPAQTYDMFIVKYVKKTASMAFANENAHHVGYVIMFAEAGSDLSTKLATTFGV